MHSLGPFAVCCYSVFKDHPGRLILPDCRAAQGRDEVRNLTKSKQPVNNFLTQIIRFTTLTLPAFPGWLASNVTHPATAAKYSIMQPLSIKKMRYL
jgi:hypothetical protein